MFSVGDVSDRRIAHVIVYVAQQIGTPLHQLLSAAHFAALRVTH